MPALRGFEVLSIGCCQSSWHAMPALRGFELDWALQFAVVPNHWPNAINCLELTSFLGMSVGQLFLFSIRSKN
jgi:hypothetical protein